MAAPVKASLTTALAGADNDIIFTSKWNAAKGNATRISYVDPGAVNCRGYVVADDDGQAPFIMVVLKRTAAAITMTANEVRALIEAHPIANSLVAVQVVAADTGAGAVIALASTPLASGVDAAFASKAEAETIFSDYAAAWIVDGAADLILQLRGGVGPPYVRTQLSGTDASKMSILNDIYNNLARKGRGYDILPT
jgi:hypothetical protein